jgi:uncharacterized protein with HEPN domain
MTEQDDSAYIGHMLDMAQKAVAKIADKSRLDFDTNEDLQIVVTHLIQVIGEAASRVSRQTRREHPEIPWNEIVGMRHRVVHDYMDIVWDVACNKLPRLIELLRPLVPPEEQ